MKRLIVVLCLCLALPTLVLAQLSGPLSGTLGPGSYTVEDTIYVLAGESLTINPGTDFLFNGAFGFGIAGTLTAVGDADNIISFIPNAGVPFWSGMEFTSSSSPNCQLVYCLISGSNDMGVYLHSAPSVTISHCTFTLNSSSYMGGGCYSESSNSYFSHCVFSFNTALHGGGLVLRYMAPALVDNLVFYGNSGTYGGAMAQYFVSGFALTNCLFYQNDANAGAGIRMSSSPSEVVNCTFAENSAADGGAIFVINQIPTGKNLIAWGNTGTGPIYVYAGGFTCTYSDIQGGFTGTGNIDTDPLFVTGPDGEYYLSQVAAGQEVNSPCWNTGDPVSPMIMGTTRTDQIQDAGIVDMGYHYAAVLPTLTVALTPIGAPIQIPPSGGSFEYNALITNNGATPMSFDVWIMVTLPIGAPYGPVLGPVNLTLPAGISIERDRIQEVPGGAPPGIYEYIAYVGIYPDTVYDQSSFDFEKLDDGDGEWISDWVNTGESFDQWLTDPLTVTTELPTSIALIGNHPNPFNPTTTLSFTLPEATRVNLSIYDAQGRLVATVVDGWRQAGMHEATFDGSDLASGVYIYRLMVGDYTSSGKMVLMK